MFGESPGFEPALVSKTSLRSAPLPPPLQFADRLPHILAGPTGVRCLRGGRRRASRDLRATDSIEGLGSVKDIDSWVTEGTFHRPLEHGKPTRPCKSGPCGASMTRFEL